MEGENGATGHCAKAVAVVISLTIILRLCSSQKGSKRHNWKQRWFSIEGKNLVYYKGKSKRRRLGSVDLRGCKVDAVKNEVRTGKKSKENKAKSSAAATHAPTHATLSTETR